jgi:hypothetical protein
LQTIVFVAAQINKFCRISLGLKEVFSCSGSIEVLCKRLENMEGPKKWERFDVIALVLCRSIGIFYSLQEGLSHDFYFNLLKLHLVLI